MRFPLQRDLLGNVIITIRSYTLSGVNLLWKLGSRGSGFENWRAVCPRRSTDGGAYTQDL